MKEVKQGDRVLFWPGYVDIGHQQTKDTPFVAFVAYVWNNYKVNLTYVDHNGQQFGAVQVNVVHKPEDKPAGEKEHRYCEYFCSTES